MSATGTKFSNLIRAKRIITDSTFPTEPRQGDMFVDTANNRFYIWDTGWYFAILTTTTSTSTTSTTTSTSTTSTTSSTSTSTSTSTSSSTSTTTTL